MSESICRKYRLSVQLHVNFMNENTCAIYPAKPSQESLSNHPEHMFFSHKPLWEWTALEKMTGILGRHRHNLSLSTFPAKSVVSSTPV